MLDRKINNEKVFAKNPDIVARKIADEMILVPILKSATDLSEVYSMDKVGALIWELIDGVLTVEQITHAITAKFKVEPNQAETDIKEFLTELEDVNAIYAITDDKDTFASRK